jgi:AraC family transcriptional regulator of adaptative response/methylated-DNA-[protein]-cysteine methyltransferase
MTATAILNEMNRQAVFQDDDDARWQAVIERDASRDGSFVFAVSSTGVYCRPSCPAKRPRRGNVRFFKMPDVAERAGYRACLRCHPKMNGDRPQVELTKAVCRYIEQHFDQPSSLNTLSRIFGQSPFHLQRTFKALLGITPRQYVDSCRMGRFKNRLRGGQDVTGALYEAGYSSSSRVYENTSHQLGMTPNQYRRGASSMLIHYGFSESPLGLMLVAKTQRGICAIHFGDSTDELENELIHEFPFATRRRDDSELSPQLQAVVHLLAGQKLPTAFPLDIQATAFQRRVWDHLRTIPPGTTQSYSEVAKAVGSPCGARAVAGACAANRLAVAIPCHRVVAQNGQISGYRWGRPRKELLLRMEKDWASRS